MAGAKQLGDTGFILVTTGAIRPAVVCSRHCIALHSGWQFPSWGRIPAGIRPERGGDGGQIRPAGEAGRSPEIETGRGRGDVSPAVTLRIPEIFLAH
jgi:hypothetical protein